MSNENEVKQDNNQRETEVTVGIRRVYNVGSYESLEVKVETTDKIRWSTIQERIGKTDKLSKLLVKKFDESRMSIFKGLNAVEKNVNFKGLVQAGKENNNLE